MQQEVAPGPVKAWIEPDRWALYRAFPRSAALLAIAALASLTLGYAVHPAFFLLTALTVVRHAAAEASLRELFRDGMLHPARVLEGARGRLATLVRLEQGGKMQDAVVISRIPRRWTREGPPWGGARAAMVIAGNAPRLRPLSADVAVGDPARGLRATERIPDAQWRALDSALAQLDEVSEGVHPVQLGALPWYGSVRDLEVEGSLPEHLADTEPHAWCAGLPCIEEPAMVEPERARVRALRRRALRRVALLIGVFVCTLLAALFVGLAEFVRALLSAVVIFGAPFVLIEVVATVRRMRAYSRDLERGKLLRFGGTLSNFDSLALDRDLARLARKKVLSPEPGLEQDLVLLPDASELLYANGKWAPAHLKLAVASVASPPSDAVKLALPAELKTDRTIELELGRRRLSGPELIELERHLQILRKPGLAFLLLTPLALSIVLVWSERASSMPASFASAPFVLALWLLTAQAFWRRLRLSARLRADKELGWVITVDHARSSHPYAFAEPELPARGIESLQHSRLDWTVNRRPASWRRAGR
jgi:hypothetical protein